MMALSPRRSPSLLFGSPLAAAALLLLAAAAAGAAAGDGVDCAECHEDAPPAIEGSLHAGFACVDCHAAFSEADHPAEMSGAAGCADCHPDAVAELATSAHRPAGNPEAPANCADCHGPIHLLVGAAEPASPIHPRRLAATCGRCHADPELAMRAGLHVARPLAAYEASVHARALAEGREGASCIDCHGGHDIAKAGSQASRVSAGNLPESCGRCHSEIAGAYRASVHGRAAAAGVDEAPVCTDCHGEHRILSPRDRGSPVYATNLSRVLCGRCHGDLALSEKFGLDVAAVASYRDSYHGLAARAGAVAVANCASCHGIHDILPSSDPASHIHQSRKAETCGACHPGAGSRFAIGSVHLLPTEREHAAIFWIRRIYVVLIVLTIGVMVLHNLADLARKARHRRGASPLPPVAGRERLSLGFRSAHLLLMVSFALLVWTGFALKFPEAWWSAPLLQWEDDMAFRGLLHRLAACLLLVAVAVHAAHLAVSARARRVIRHMRPRRADWRELRERLRFFAGGPEPRPRLIGYAEKLEYFAVVWGTLLMTATGFLLWFDNATLRWLPKWVLDVATVIHLYEAILASLAILVWHFYQVIFDPLVYPMDPAWISGRSAPGRSRERHGH